MLARKQQACTSSALPRMTICRAVTSAAARCQLLQQARRCLVRDPGPHCSPTHRIGGRASLVWRRAAVVTAAAPPSDVFVLDFDGVLVDSEPEVSIAGFQAAAQLWPEHLSGANRAAVLQGLRVVRPVVVSGWETVIQARLLAENGDAGQMILADWPALQRTALQQWGTDLDDLRRVFEESRNKWMTEQEETASTLIVQIHMQDWLSYVKPYQNVVSTLKYTEVRLLRGSPLYELVPLQQHKAQLPFYIVSSKAAHRVARVAEKQLGLDLPADSPRLFAGAIPPNEEKIRALKTISERPLVSEAGAKMHFIDDRLETVKAVAADVSLRDGPGKLQVYYATWGYCTDEEKEEAETIEGVRSITLPQFNELVKWGILMGVDDGCGDDN